MEVGKLRSCGGVNNPTSLPDKNVFLVNKVGWLQEMFAGDDVFRPGELYHQKSVIYHVGML